MAGHGSTASDARPLAMTVTVAIPVRNGEATLHGVLEAVRAQQVDVDVEILLADSGSTDDSVAVARAHGAEVIRVPAGEFSHGGTRNMLVERASGAHVALLTQDAVPIGRRWLATLLDGFGLASGIALTFGPYRARPGAPARLERELRSWFWSFSPDGAARVDRLTAPERSARPGALLGPRAFFTDANGCIAKDAWREVPFRSIAYAEDHQLALDMLFAGYAKAFLPDAAVLHSHDYTVGEQLRRSFDEWRALHEIYGYVEPADVAAVRRVVIGATRADLRHLRAGGTGGAGLARAAVDSGAHHAARLVGAVLGGRAERLPFDVRRRLSLEGRATFSNQRTTRT
jgi:glycosyltransferase involved in cell wall biosynthesis